MFGKIVFKLPMAKNFACSAHVLILRNFPTADVDLCCIPFLPNSPALNSLSYTTMSYASNDSFLYSLNNKKNNLKVKTKKITFISCHISEMGDNILQSELAIRQKLVSAESFPYRESFPYCES